MFYIIQVEIDADGIHHEKGYLASNGLICDHKRSAYPYRTYTEAKEYLPKAKEVYKLEKLKIVTR